MLEKKFLISSMGKPTAGELFGSGTFVKDNDVEL